jgi:uncharacterized protein
MAEVWSTYTRTRAGTMLLPTRYGLRLTDGHAELRSKAEVAAAVCGNEPMIRQAAQDPILSGEILYRFDVRRGPWRVRALPTEPGFGSASDIVSAGEQAFQAALRGDADAWAELVRLRGSLTELAASGDGRAHSLLGGIALEYDKKPADAFHHFQLAAQQGDPGGQRGLGHLYSAGLGVERDLEAAERLFRLAVDAGDPYAKYNLAMIHLRGQSAARMSPEEVMSLLMEAAEQGIAQASKMLGDWFAKMDREPEACAWYLKAANGGNGEAMFALAKRLRHGRGTERDEVQALCWFVKMLQIGNGDGIHEAVQMARSMSDADIRRAGRMAGDLSSAEALIQTVRPSSSG